MSRDAQGDRGPDHLVLAPFRGVRYDPTRLADLALVTAPPYDVVDADDVAALEAADARNVVRLTRPRPPGSDPAAHYAEVRSRWRAWLADGTLRVDPAPALYAYEHRSDTHTSAGLIGALALPDPYAGVVLPHEDVLPGPVADRLALLETTEANFEPILLVVGDRSGPRSRYVGSAAPVGSSVSTALGSTALGSTVDRVRQTAPLISAVAEHDEHRLWAVTDADVLSAVAADLSGASALIADGHHRFASYRRLRAQRRAAGRGPGPWDYGLALLVDAVASPLRLAAIDRLVAGVSLDALVATAGQQHIAVSAQAEPSPLPGSPVLGDGTRFVRLHLQPRSPGSTDGQPLDVDLLDRLFARAGVVEADVTYVHDRAHVLSRAMQGHGLAVLVAPVALSTVTERARSGRMMPRKSTSFGPKPRSGLVMRSLLH